MTVSCLFSRFLWFPISPIFFFGIFRQDPLFLDILRLWKFERERENKRRKRHTKCECRLQARTKEEGTRRAREVRGGRAAPRALSSRIPPGKLLTVRTFRETPRTPSYIPSGVSLPRQMPIAREVRSFYDSRSKFTFFSASSIFFALSDSHLSSPLRRLLLGNEKGKECARDKGRQRARMKNRMTERHPFLENFLSVT